MWDHHVWAGVSVRHYRSAQIQENIAAIANQIGCENQNNSAVTFRDVMKIAPIEYKKHNIGE